MRHATYYSGQHIAGWLSVLDDQGDEGACTVHIYSYARMVRQPADQDDLLPPPKRE